MRNVNMLLHLFGYFSKQLTQEEKIFFLDNLEKYQNKRVPFSLPLTIIKTWVIRFENEYLLSQKIFEAFPMELIEVTDSGKGI
ncbi:YbgA family protein [Clostridium gasigenes]|nr:YbgA family protein [Clostridium gasigenes]